jgi:hypothetical protein
MQEARCDGAETECVPIGSMLSSGGNEDQLSSNRMEMIQSVRMLRDNCESSWLLVPGCGDKVTESAVSVGLLVADLARGGWDGNPAAFTPVTCRFQSGAGLLGCKTQISSNNTFPGRLKKISVHKNREGRNAIRVEWEILTARPLPRPVSGVAVPVQGCRATLLKRLWPRNPIREAFDVSNKSIPFPRRSNRVFPPL